MKHKYSSEYFVEVKSSGRNTRSVYDLNIACTNYFYTTTLHKGMRREDYHKISESDYSEKLFSLSKSIVEYLNGYAIDGRVNIMRSIFSFLSFQAKRDLSIGDREGLEEWCLDMKKLVFSKGMTEMTARAMLSAANKFLVFRGKINKKISFIFSNATKASDSNIVYTTNEFNAAIYLLHTAFNVFESALKEHCEGIENGTRIIACLFPKSATGSYQEIKLKVNGKDYIYDAIISNPVRGFNLVSFYLFTYYTSAPKHQSINLAISDIITQESGQIVTNYLFKGRAFKFVRFGIGKSEIETDRAGIIWFNRFLDMKQRYLKCLESAGVECTDGKLFHSLEEYNSGIKKFIPLIITPDALYSKNLWWKLYNDGYKIPRFNVRAIRKMTEQLIDFKGNDPLLTTAKAQHEWETYKKNYSRGNRTDNLYRMSNALKTLVEGGAADLSFKERQKLASEHNFNLVSKNDINYITTATGLGCNQNGPITTQEERFFREQQREGRQPKVCANVLECLDCTKCGIIDSEENYYEVLSFREAIRLNKATYTGSDVAEGNYDRLLKKLDERLVLADQSKLLKAKKRLNKNGVSDIWRITI